MVYMTRKDCEATSPDLIIWMKRSFTKKGEMLARQKQLMCISELGNKGVKERKSELNQEKRKESTVSLWIAPVRIFAGTYISY
jgi:hypothetical protein